MGGFCDTFLLFPEAPASCDKGIRKQPFAAFWFYLHELKKYFFDF